MATEISQNMDQYKDEFMKRAEEIVTKVFPQRVDRLTTVIENDLFKFENAVHENIHIPVMPQMVNVQMLNGKGQCEDTEDDYAKDVKVLLFPNGPVQCHGHVTEMINILRPHITQLIKDANMLKIGIMLMMPKIEDGDNFGVAIQEEVLDEVDSAESSALTKLDQIGRYFEQRAKLITKIAQYPQCDDYRRTVLEHDEQYRVMLCLNAAKIRNNYIRLHDVITKNMSKIKKPRNADKINAMY